MIRIGLGYDVHRLVPGRPLILGGVEIAHDHGLAGHSDADVLVHAVCDAILGALADGDIGTHFPDSDPRYHDADSLDLLSHVVALMKRRHYEVVNIDTVLMLEQPRIAPHRESMRQNLARVLDVSEERVSIKATTTEKLGFEGRRQGIAAHAVVLLALPECGIFSGKVT